MKRLIILLLLLAIAQSGLSAKPMSSFAGVKLSRLIDGDTFSVDLSCTHDVFCKDISVRVRGIDTPELRSKNPKEREAARKAKQFTKEFLEAGQVDLLNCSRDKYFRLLCDVTSDGEDLASALFKAGLAKPYFGGKKQKWNF